MVNQVIGQYVNNMWLFLTCPNSWQWSTDKAKALVFDDSQVFRATISNARDQAKKHWPRQNPNLITGILADD